MLAKTLQISRRSFTLNNNELVRSKFQTRKYVDGSELMLGIVTGGLIGFMIPISTAPFCLVIGSIMSSIVISTKIFGTTNYLAICVTSCGINCLTYAFPQLYPWLIILAFIILISNASPDDKE